MYPATTPNPPSIRAPRREPPHVDQDPYAYTPPGGHQLAPDFAGPSHAKTSSGIKWVVVVLGLAVVIGGAIVGVHALNTSGGGNSTLSGSGFDSVIEQESTTLTDVDCATVPNRAGYIFDCTAVVAGKASPLDVRVTLNDTAGHFVWALTPQTAGA